MMIIMVVLWLKYVSLGGLDERKDQLMTIMLIPEMILWFLSTMLYNRYIHIVVGCGGL